MKKLLKILALCIAMLCLAGCGRTEPPADEGVQPQPLPERSLPALTREESMDMLCYAAANRARVLDGKLYTLDYGADFAPLLAVYSMEDGLKRTGVLAENCVPEYLTECGGRLFYLNAAAGNALESIDPDGGGRKVLREGPCSFLLAVEGSLCYCDAQGRYCRVQPDGGAEETLLDEPCAWPWPLGDALLYQSLRDGRLHLRKLEDGTDVTLTAQNAAAPVLWGDRLFYSADDGLHSMDLNGLDERLYRSPALLAPAELLPTEESVQMRGLTREEGLRQWTAQLADTEGTLRDLTEHGYRLRDYIGPEGQVDAVYNPDGRLRCFVFTDSEGHETVYMAGGVSE